MFFKKARKKIMSFIPWKPIFIILVVVLVFFILSLISKSYEKSKDSDDWNVGNTKASLGIFVSDQ